MNQEQDWTEAYKELCALIRSEVPEIKHIDLWYDQTNYLEEEYPFPDQCLFFDIDLPETESIGVGVQSCNAIITAYHCFKTLSDSYDQSTNQSTALDFMPVNRKIYKCLQSRSGNNFSPLDRKSNKRVPHPEGYLLIRAQEFHGIIMDYAAMKEWTDTTINNVNITKGEAPAVAPETDMYNIEL